MKRLLLTLILLLPACSAGAQSGVSVVAVYPHQTDAFTQGLVFEDGRIVRATAFLDTWALQRLMED